MEVILHYPGYQPRDSKYKKKNTVVHLLHLHCLHGHFSTSFQVNMKSKLTWITFLLHTQGLAVNNLSVNVILKKKTCLSFIRLWRLAQSNQLLLFFLVNMVLFRNMSHYGSKMGWERTWAFDQTCWSFRYLFQTAFNEVKIDTILS